MNIKVEVTSRKPLKSGVFKGIITIDDWYETLHIPANRWTIQDYERQWQEGLERIKKENTSCLVTYVGDHTKGPGIGWWPMWKIDNIIHIQNQWISYENYDRIIDGKPFTPDTCYSFIGEHKTHTENGLEISEWLEPVSSQE